MKKLLSLLFFISILSCENPSQKIIAQADSSDLQTIRTDSISSNANHLELHDSISGDFDGDGKKEFAVLAMTKKGNLNLIASDDAAAEFQVIFRNEKIKALNVG